MVSFCLIKLSYKTNLELKKKLDETSKTFKGLNKIVSLKASTQNQFG